MTPSNVIEHDFGAVQEREERDEDISDCSGEYHGYTISIPKKAASTYCDTSMSDSRMGSGWRLMNINSTRT